MDENNQALCVRSATIDDLPEILKIELESYGSYAYNYVVLRQLIDLAPQLFMVAETDAVIGFSIGMISPEKQSGWILALLVAPPHRRSGIGYRLARTMTSRLFAFKIEYVSLTVAPQNSEAKNLYLRLGYAADHHAPNYFGPRKDRLVFRKYAHANHQGREVVSRFPATSPEEITNFLRKRVSRYYWVDDINCATATLKILSELFGIYLDTQIIDASLGMHGGGGHRAQCGLVEGTLMFIGILGRQKRVPDNTIVALCKEFAQEFEMKFASLLCRNLRPEGFHPDNPPHLCEPLTVRANNFSVSFLKKNFFR